MLGKLLKYDFKSIGRSMFPVYLLTVALSVILSVMVRMRVDYSKAFTAALILFVSLVVGSTIGTVVLLNQRFTRGLLGNEGYLYFALPVRTSSHIASKLLNAIIWGLLQVVVVGVCAALMGVPFPVIRYSLKTFRGVEHRIESVRGLDGVEYFNDSKGTNVDSTLKAVETMTRPTVLILGGYDKHVSFDALSREIMEKKDIIRETVLIGETAPQIAESLRAAGYEDILYADTMRDAVLMCRQIAEDGWNVLLSPACASFDMFRDYEERGRVFKKIVNEL